MRVILLAHMDDELFLLPFINDEVPKLLIYLTSSVSRAANSKQTERRLSESRVIFERYLSSKNCKVFWYGNAYLQPENELHKFTSLADIDTLLLEIEKFPQQVSELITTTFEGAHHDHDSAAFIAREVGKRLKLIPIEVSTYPMKYKNFYSYQVISPRFPQALQIKFNRKHILFLALKLILAYKTQRKTWIGLGGQLIFNYAFKSFKVALPAPIGIQTRCFYEFRGRAKQTEVISQLGRLSV
jgi:hypothetical protein